MGYTTAQANNFIAMASPIIRAEATKRGYLICSTTIAQAIIEGACGTSKLAMPPYNNHFGLKCGSSWTGRSVNMKTKEEYTIGSPVTIKDNFRCYDSFSDCVCGHGGYYDFINTKRYANLKTAQNYIEFAQFLKADGYATSSTYVNTLCSTVQKYNLEAWDSVVPTSEYVIGKTYTLQSNMYIRDGASGNKVDYYSITTNAQLNAYTDDEGYSILRKGTRVTCKGTEEKNGMIWMQIPSGWVCARDSKKTYIM